MKVSISWLDEWIQVADLDPAELAHRMTMAGLEVDSIEYQGQGHDDIVVGQITAIEEHPNADRLVVCKVDAGDDKERTIVCGATNMEAGDCVPVALVGASPPGVDFEIVAREVMSVASEGMLCSAEELELADDSEGLLIIDAGSELGTPIFEALELQDVILEIDLTPNRADCLSHLGVAREVAALYGRELRPQRVQIPAVEYDETRSVEEAAGLEIVDDKGCPHYRMAVLENVEIAASPAWLRQRLGAVGIRSINSIVDVTNFVLMDIGQPLHAFDLDELEGPAIVVRRAEEGERLLGIDHEEYELHTDDLVIADQDKPVALAGVMGGAESEVGDDTSRILLECAYFDPSTVRRASKRHGLHTDSSHRFERGIDPGAVSWAMERAIELLVRVQNEVGEQAPVVRADVAMAGQENKSRKQVELAPGRVAQVLGIDIDAQQCRRHLESIGLEVEVLGDGRLLCAVPTSRGDLRRPVDLVEEIARLHGYDEIPVTLPTMSAGAGHGKKKPESKETIVSRTERRILDWMRAFLLDQGLLEAVNYSFMGEEDLDRLRLDDDDCRRMAPQVANPLIKSQARMRTTLITSLLDNVETNFAQSRRDVALFEIGRRYFTTGEVRTLAVAVTGERRRHWSGTSRWDFFDLKGMVESLATPCQLEETRWERPEIAEPYLHPGVQAVWKYGDSPLGFVGQLHPAVAQDEGLEQPIFFAEIDLEALLQLGPRQVQAVAPAKYPAVVRDFALLYDEARPYGELEEAIAMLVDEDQQFAQLFEAVELFDVYEGEQVPEGRRSLAIKVTYRSQSRTLEESEIEDADRQLLSHLQEKVDARLR